VNTTEELKVYLYQPDIGYTSLQNGKNFDIIDVVIINSDHKYKPWSRENLEVTNLLTILDFDSH
jgi:hypothetical protein